MRIANLVALRGPTAPSAAARLARDGFEIQTTAGWTIGLAAASVSARDSASPPPTFLLEGDDQLTLSDAVLSGDERAIAALPGDFAFFHPSSDGTAIVVSSVAGVVPIYYSTAATDDHVLVTTRLRDMVRYGPLDPKLDHEAVAIFLTTNAWAGDRTFLRDVRVLRPGSVLRVDRSATPVKYWDWPEIESGPPTRAAFLEASDALRSGLLERIDRSLAATGNLVALSGGVDSAVVAALATGCLKRRISTLTFLPTDERLAAREREYLSTVWRHAKGMIERRYQFPLGLAERLTLIEQGPRLVFPTAHPLLQLLPRLRASEDLRVYAGGELADGLFGSLTVIDDWASRLSLQHLVKRPTMLPFAIRHARTVLRHRRALAAGRPPLPLAGFAGDLLSPELAAVHRQCVRDWQRDAIATRRGAFGLRLSRAHALKAALWEGLTTHDMVPSFPFHGREMLELALRVDPVQNAGWTGKRLLRHAALGLVPKKNLSRPDKGNYPHKLHDLPWNLELPDELSGLIRADWLPRPPGRIHAFAALRLQGLVNIVEALRNERRSREQLRDV